MTETPKPESAPAGDINPWPLFPEKKVSVERARVPRAAVGFFRRALAFIMDLVFIEWIAILFSLIGLSAHETALGGGGLLSADFDQLSRLHSSAWFIVFLAYFTFFGHYGGQTPAKMVFRFGIVLNNGEAVPLTRSLLRTLAYFLGFFSLGLGFLMAVFTPSGRALHDYLAGTRLENRARE